MKSLIWGVLTVFALTLVTPVSAAEQDVVRVVVEGEGTSEQEAKERAFQNAAEQAKGVLVESSTTVENHEVIKDRIKTHAEAFIQEYKILKRALAADGTVSVTLEAVINPGKIHDDLEALRILTDRLGTPRFMVINDHRVAENRGDAEVTAHAVAAVNSFLTNKLLEVVDQEQVEKLRQDDTAAVGAKESRAQAIAKKLKAAVYVTVYGHVEHSASVNVRVFESATGRILGEDTGYSRSADGYLADQKEAIAKAVSAAMGKAFNTMMGYWRRDTAQGQQIPIVVHGLDFKSRVKFRKLLERLVADGGQVKQISATTGYAEFMVWTKLGAGELSENVALEAEESGFRLGHDPVQTGNRIIFKFK